MHNIDRIVWGIFVFCFYDANVISENIDDGPIFPAIFGGESGFLKTLDSGGGLQTSISTAIASLRHVTVSRAGPVSREV